MNGCVFDFYSEFPKFLIGGFYFWNEIKVAHFLGQSSLADFEHQLSLSNFLFKPLSPLMLPHGESVNEEKWISGPLLLQITASKVYSICLPSHAFKYVCLFLTHLVILSRKIHAGESLIACSRNLIFVFVINNASDFSHLHNLLLMVYVNQEYCQTLKNTSVNSCSYMSC